LPPARFIVASGDLDRGFIQLRGAELRHLRARRLGPGDEIVVTDGAGRERRGTIENVAPRHAQVRLHLGASQHTSSESKLHLDLAQAALKADKLDLVIEKATELGVSSVTIFSSTRCVSKPAPGRLDRWTRIAQSATAQSQRAVVPVIRGPVTFAEVLSTAAARPRLLFWEQAVSERLDPRLLRATANVLAVVGPEGGFEPTEVAAARSAGFHIVGLGPRILRAETAAIVAVTLCQRLWGDL
jgi:16S rRNA (uracil1498-N3)-methyltransferase